MNTKAFLSASALAVLCACSPILMPGQPAPRLFVLNAPHAAAATPAAQPLPLSLQIIQPLAASGLDGDRIALRKGTDEMDYVAGARWSGHVPALVQAQLVEAFEGSGALRAVGSDLIQFHADDVLSVEIRRFEVEYEGAKPTRAHVLLAARLIDAHDSNIVSTAVYEESEPVAAVQVQDMVGALNAAFVRASTRIVTDVTATLGKAQIAPVLTPPVEDAPKVEMPKAEDTPKK